MSCPWAGGGGACARTWWRPARPVTPGSSRWSRWSGRSTCARSTTPGRHDAPPAAFFGSAATWYGYEVPIYRIVTNPPLSPYYMALVASVAGWSEIALHLAFLVAAVAAGVGTLVLARRFCAAPAVAALVGVLT